MEKFIFYDTCSLLSGLKTIFENDVPFFISSITLSELEGIKTSGTKDEGTKYQARKLLHKLAENRDKYEIILYNSSFDQDIKDFNLPMTNDSKIIISARNTFLDRGILADSIFHTADLACQAIAKAVGLNVEFIDPDNQVENDFKGFVYYDATNDEGLAHFYSNIEEIGQNNTFELLENEYLLVRDKTGEVVDKYRYNNGHLTRLKFCSVESKLFGKITPKDQDVYQHIALDSLMHNKITVLKGPAGSGKSYLSFGFMFDQLEKGIIDKIIIFCNTIATKGSAKLGYYPGSRTEKLLDSQIGNLLSSKLGDRAMVERLIDDGVLVLLPMSDIRGYDTSGMNAAVYISEAQNLDIELMKLALQRIGEDGICILDGDSNAQVDSSLYAGSNNGMRRVSEVFRNHDFYGEVELQNIHRSKIAELAQLM